jgi:type II secretory ATPase GspE/PulE/Tfp pilus assembly ATPase PilB-like protein
MIIDRLEELGADRNLVLSPGMIKGLFAQNLVAKLCPNCKRKLVDHIDELEPDLIERLETTYKDMGGLEDIYIRGTYTLRSGCGYHDKDNDLWCISGYIDRMVIAEFIMPDSEFLQLMYDRRLLDAQKHWFNNLGGYTMMAHGLAKVKTGILDPRTLEEKLEQLSPQMNLDKAIDDVI